VAPLYSLASLYKYAKARPGSPVRIRQILSKYERSSTSLSSFSLNLEENYQPVIELYQTTDQPALSPKSGGPEWRVNSADSGSPCGKPARNTCQLTWRGGGGGTLCMWLGLAHFHSGFSFLMISPNLLDIWPVFFLILSPYGMLHFLIVLGLQVMAILCWTAKNSLRGTNSERRRKIHPKKRTETVSICHHCTLFHMFSKANIFKKKHQNYYK
jgi:hypothetical protein